MIDELHSNLDYLILQVFVKLVIGLLLGYFIGRSRPIGIAWTAFFSVTFWPIGALIFVLLSPKIVDTEIKVSKFKKITGWIFLVAGTLSLLGIVTATVDNEAMRSHPILLFTFVFGLIGAGIYLILRGGGRSFHQRT